MSRRPAIKPEKSFRRVQLVIAVGGMVGTRLMSVLDQVETICPIHKAMMIIGKRWTALLIRDLVTGTKRFCELEQSLKGISPKMLSARLHELEAGGLVSRAVFAEVPVKVEYSLTEKGRDLKSVIDSMAVWGEKWP